MLVSDISLQTFYANVTGSQQHPSMVSKRVKGHFKVDFFRKYNRTNGQRFKQLIWLMNIQSRVVYHRKQYYRKQYY